MKHENTHDSCLRIVEGVSRLLGYPLLVYELPANKLIEGYPSSLLTFSTMRLSMETLGLQHKGLFCYAVYPKFRTLTLITSLYYLDKKRRQ